MYPNPSSQNPGYPPQAGSAYPPGAAPPATLFDAVAGYEKTVYGQGYAPPPPTAPPMPEERRPDEEFVSGASITAEEAQDAMENFVASNCCYGSSPAKEMEIRDITPSSAYHYKLSSFTESRQTAWEYEPFTGQVVDGPHNGPAPGPWQIHVQPVKMFSPSSTKAEVPHTASVKQCHECYGGGYNQCKTCGGRGWSKCNTCQGRKVVKDNFDEEKPCHACSGSGERRCPPCNGDGRIKCDVCKGHCRLKTFILLTVTWKKHLDSEKTIERPRGGPKDKVKEGGGMQIFHQQLPRMWPISSFFDNEINAASQQFVNEHATSWPEERILCTGFYFKMAERKVLNKYFPPDFDPAKLPKLKLDKDRQYVVRLMAPFNMRCSTCGEYIYKGKKFNARKETVLNETYLGLEIYRFYIRCPRCISEITFKTDPENTDYVAEKGATRNFQAIKRAEDEEERLKREREEEELNNPMKALENRTKESKQEMDILEKLEELRDLNARHASVDHEKLLQQNMKYRKEIEERQAQEDEDLVQSVFGQKKLEKRLESDSSDSEDEASKGKLKRQHPGEDVEQTGKATDLLVEESPKTSEPSEKKLKSWEKSVGTLNKVSLASLVKKKTTTSAGEGRSTSAGHVVVNSNSNNAAKVSPAAGGLSLVGNYSSGDSSDET